ncbi:tetraacyldisaccharide 4'-kinase [Schleiferia thermophila]|uniref:tetraacyldisaccharide 4'-kinase n=1 Tax=Schleiferia thermophila TaxID=884107 RepID=UPI003EE83C99
MSAIIFSIKRILLIPLVLPIYLVIKLRHILFNLEILLSEKPEEIRTIAVGNLSFGGTGKTPMVQLLIQLLSSEYQIAVLSRGYGRTTKGFRIVEPDDDYQDVGDEPLLIKQNFPDVPVAVCEDRLEGIRKLKGMYPDLNLIILDDALQHRKVHPDVSVLLTTWDKPYFSDCLFPAGTLRDLKERAKNVDVTVITKTPADASIQRKKALQSIHSKYSGSPVFFCTFINTIAALPHPTHQKVAVVSTIANPDQMVQSVRLLGFCVKKIYRFKDHQTIDPAKWIEILEYCMRFNLFCIVTQKEKVKLPKELYQAYRHLIGILEIEFVIENKTEFINIIKKKLMQ